MVYLFLAIGALVFVVGLNKLGIAPRIREVVTASLQARGIISSTCLTDEAKELAIQQATIAMAAGLALILGRLALCLLISGATVWVGAQSGAYSIADALVAASDWMFIVISSVVMIGALAFVRCRRQS